MWLAPIRTKLADQKMNDFDGALDDWYNFVDEIKAHYGVDMNVLTKPYSDEQKRYYLQVAATGS